MNRSTPCLGALALLVLPLVGFAHEDSVSHSRIAVRDREAVLELRCQTKSLLEAIAGLDASGNGALEAMELDAGRTAIETYLLDHYRLRHAADAPSEVGEELAPRIASLGFATDLADAERRFQWIDARIVFTSSQPLGELVVRSRLFTEKDPYHRDFLVLTWNDDGPVEHLFRHGAHDWHFQPAHTRRPGVLAIFVRLGIEHILGGYDHLCFLLALIVASRTVRSLVGVVTAFTLAHSITLALAALGVVRLDQGFIELAIALSIAYVAGENLLRRGPRTPWLEAFVFGLLHGLGFAGFLGEALVGEHLVVTALFGFNVGVEAGQLQFVVAFPAAALGWRRLRRSAPRAADEGASDGIVPAWLRQGASAIIVVVALYWFAQRAGWIG